MKHVKGFSPFWYRSIVADDIPRVGMVIGGFVAAAFPARAHDFFFRFMPPVVLIGLTVSVPWMDATEASGE